MTMNELIMKAREKKCSDIHISEGMPVSFRIHGQLLDSGFSFPAAETRGVMNSGNSWKMATTWTLPLKRRTIAASVSMFSGR